jgi:hypothetical protein
MNSSSPQIQSDDRLLWGEREQVQHFAVGIIMQAIHDLQVLSRPMTRNEIIHNKVSMLEILEFFEKDLDRLMETFKLQVDIEPLLEKMNPALVTIRSYLYDDNVIVLPVRRKEEDLPQAVNY